MNIIEKLKQQFIENLSTKYTLDPSALSSITFAINTDEQRQQFGDISTNAALIVAASAQQNPRSLAQDIIDTFSHPAIARMELAGPGFINITLTDDIYIDLSQKLYTHPQSFFKTMLSQYHRFSLEFVSANPTGPLHLGHGRGGIIGDVLGNILQFIGHQVTKEYYINDAGSQIEKLGLSFKIRCQQALGVECSMPEDGYHGDYLIELAKKLAQERGPDLLIEQDSFFAHYAKDAMLGQIAYTLQMYGIFFDLWVSEKRLHEESLVKRAIDFLKKHGATYEKDGALWFTSTRYGDDKDRVLIKSNGEMTYIASDVAYTEDKFKRADRLILVLGQDHHSYVVRLKGIAEALGHNPKDLDVILYQLITLKEGDQQLRMSKRAGTMVTLREVIETVGKDVARFFFLHRKADAHLDFDLELALKKTEENPVYYIQYAYVRTKSILHKSQEYKDFDQLTEADFNEMHIDHYERLIIKKFVVLKELLLSISENYHTHLLTYYSIELAQLFHRYYATHRILDSGEVKKSRHRLILIKLFQETFELCLNLLGLSKPEKM